jgi:hypothetical protein
MDSFTLNSAKSYVGKRVNLHLRDGTVLVNVRVEAIEDKRFVRYVGGKHQSRLVSLRNVSYAQIVSLEAQLLSEAS